MSISLKPNETCKFSTTCPYNKQNTKDFCRGSDPERVNWFVCDLVNDKGEFNISSFRSRLDENGQMQIIMENEDG
jgi:hypothetical protein